MGRDTNAQLFHILEKLDEKAAEDEIRLDKRSAKFVADNVERWHKQPFSFSEAQRKWIGDLEGRYL